MVSSSILTSLSLNYFGVAFSVPFGILTYTLPSHSLTYSASPTSDTSISITIYDILNYKSIYAAPNSSLNIYDVYKLIIPYYTYVYIDVHYKTYIR